MKPKKLSDTQVQNTLSNAVKDAVSFIESEIAPARIKAQKYFDGWSAVGFEEGRSKIVATKCRDTVRAAELESPAQRGHYLREFGQSDRETIENANNEASVPQALAMMNGSLLPQLLDSFSQLMLTVRKAQYPDDKVDAAYMTILSRKPSANEKAAWLKAQDNGLTDMQDLVFSLLNTQQFIFIQ